jgi:integrase
MTKIQIKGIHRVKKTLSNNKTVEYHYIYRGGQRFWSSTDKVLKHGPVYFQLYQEALGTAPLARGQFREILIAYQKSPEFTKLAPRTQNDINTSIFSNDGIDDVFGNAPIAAFNDHRIRKQAYNWRDRLATRSERTADARLAHLAAINTWALDRGYLVQHHLQKIKKLYRVDRSDMVWSQNEIDEFCSIAPQHVANILIVATETGLRSGDLIKLNRTHLKKTDYGTRIEMMTNKRGRVVSIPVTQTLQNLINEIPATQLQFLVGCKGLPHGNPNRLGQLITLWKKKTFVRQNLRLQDARGTAATRLFQAGLPLHNIALFMGWSPQHAAKMIEVYCQMNPADNADVLIKLQKNVT